MTDMPNTMWTLIAEARRGGDQALDQLLRKYRGPVLSFLRSCGFPAEEAEDLAQEVFLTLIEDDVLAKADRHLGRFRHLILALARHAVSAHRRHEGRLKRGGDRRRLAAPDGNVEAWLRELLATPASDPTFDLLWVRNLVWLAMTRLKEECDKDGTPHYHKALLLHTTRELDNAAIAAELGASTGDVKNWLHQARLKLKRHLGREIQGYSSSSDEYEAELDYLTKLLK